MSNNNTTSSAAAATNGGSDMTTPTAASNDDSDMSTTTTTTATATASPSSSITTTIVTPENALAAATGSPCHDWSWICQKHYFHWADDPLGVLQRDFEQHHDCSVKYLAEGSWGLQHARVSLGRIFIPFSTAHIIWVLLFDYRFVSYWLVEPPYGASCAVRAITMFSIPDEFWLVAIKDGDSTCAADGMVDHDATVFDNDDLNTPGVFVPQPHDTYRIHLTKPVRRPKPEPVPVVDITTCKERRAASSTNLRQRRVQHRQLTSLSSSSSLSSPSSASSLPSSSCSSRSSTPSGVRHHNPIFS
eukprot:TRINITY_DN250_c1_g3_i1.p1 TRINITY_DN250_c1_g3~~TRINITY_DN250_c1_g3_i1.p1  ORF type:complete len:302 (+),score=64.11 TRINITY_DN250_c1_g3_i1:349-1254(+)